ncbi:MAG TPA: heme ABC exporter ATP-binding protein CcmA [Rhizomicrobium sp.]|nr:heme ABC exporter ATP-binding protein CcmA [Rhizomicrobium sp.]
MGAIAELDVRGIALVRGDRLVLRDLDFHLTAGETLAIGGRNGAGKTSVLRALAGFLQPRSGSIVLRMADGAVVSQAEERRLHIGWLGHQDGVKSPLTPREQLRTHSRFYQCKDDIDDALSRTGLAHLRDFPVQYLSAGQRRRLALARLILGARPLWLLDEPFSALDREGKAIVRQLAESHCATGGMLIAATHEPLGLRGAAIELS